MSGNRTKTLRRALLARLGRAPTPREWRQAKRDWHARPRRARPDPNVVFERQLREWLVKEGLL